MNPHDNITYMQWVRLKPISWRWLWLAFLTPLALWRLYALEADFPLGLTSSGELFTDEGWYASSASRHAIGLPWLVNGDFNPAIQMPVGQWLLALVFDVFGASLLSTRGVSVALFSATVSVSAFWANRFFGFQAAVITALLMLVNPIGFHYSRLGIMEHLGCLLSMMGLMCASTFNENTSKSTWIGALSSASLLTIATLTKSSFISFAAVAALLVYVPRRNSPFKWLSIIPLLMPVFVFLFYQIFISVTYPADSRIFHNINIEDRLVHTPHEWISSLIQKIKDISKLGFSFTICLALALIHLWQQRRSFSKQPQALLIAALAAMFATHLGMLSFFNYSPTRYFLPLLPPICMLIAASLFSSWSHDRSPSGFMLPLFICTAVTIIFSVYQIAKTQRDIDYSFSRMLNEVEQIIIKNQNKSTHLQHKTWVAGHFSHTLMLSNGIAGINTQLTTEPPDALMQRIRPTYLLVQTNQTTDLEMLQRAGATAQEIMKWDVFGNFYGDKSPVRLYRLSWVNR